MRSRASLIEAVLGFGIELIAGRDVTGRAADQHATALLQIAANARRCGGLMSLTVSPLNS